MSIAFEHAVEVSCTVNQAFALLDDLARTPEWLANCVAIEKLTPGANAIGTQLRYKYREGRRVAVMDGEITARTPNEHLACRYIDKSMLVEVDFRVERTAGGARLVHTIDITPQTFLGRLMSPLIRRMLPKQTITAMESLRGLLERAR